MDLQATLYRKFDLKIFPEMKLRDFVSNSYILVSVSDLYISGIGLPIWLQQNPGKIQITHRYMNVGYRPL
jgi:hypothetical protein